MITKPVIPATGTQRFMIMGPRTALVLLALSFLATLCVAAGGVSVMEPALPGHAGQPPWTLGLRPSAYLVVPLTAFALAAGAAGLALALRALRAGWVMPPRALLAAGLLAAALLTLVPPFGSSDPLSYAGYGRMVVTGHNPYLTTPHQMAALGDPVARAVQDWFDAPSVYGPLASGIQGLASLAGGTSARLTVFVLDVANLLAFCGTGLLLHRMTSGEVARQLRAALLWTANPLLLQVLVAGGHVDTQMIFFAVAAVAVLRHRTAPRAVLGGLLVGLAFAVKVTGALIGLALCLELVVALRRRAAAPLAGLAAGFAAVAVPAVATGGRAMLRDASRASDMVSIGSPWRTVRLLLQHLTSHGTATSIVKFGAFALAVVLAALILRRAAHTRQEAAGWCAVAVTLGWLFAWPYVLPWYDALGWAFLALVPATALDWLLLARTTALAFGYLPARMTHAALPYGLSWVQPVFRHVLTPLVLITTSVLLVLVTLRRGSPWRSR